MVKIKTHPYAQAEVDAAIEWYEEECEHLGIEFLDEVDRAVSRIVQNPATWPNYADMPAFHRINLHRFPYAVIYRYQHDTVQIMAVAHHRREPGYWHRRIKENY